MDCEQQNGCFTVCFTNFFQKYKPQINARPKLPKVHFGNNDDIGDLYISTYSDNFVNYTSGIHGLKRTVRVPCNNNHLWRSSCVEIHQQTLRFSK